MRTIRVLVLLLLSAPLFGGERYIVEFRDGGAGAARPSDAIPRDRIRREFSRVLHGVAVELREGESIDAIARLPHVARVTRDAEVEAFGGASSQAWHVSSRLRAHAGGEGVVVAVIDSGIDYTHPALGGGFGFGRKVAGGYDFVNGDEDPMDDFRHGTHVAGIIAAKSATVTGVVPDATLLAYKVLGADGRGASSDIIAAIELSLADGADIINLSLGGFGSADDPLARAVENAISHGVVVVAAAGNDGFFHNIGSPASAPSAITVGASTAAGELAEFSNRGPATQSGAIKPDVLAPGVGIVSTIPGGGTMALNGTSMAAPYVAGLAALLLEQHPEWTPARVKAAIVTTALPLPDQEVMAQGSGIVNADRVLANALVASATQVYFGLDGVTAKTWQATRKITLRNDGAAARTVRLSATGATGAIALQVSPSEATLAAGESREVELVVTVDNESLGNPPTESLAFSGMVTVESEAQTIRLPWAFLRAARATVSYEGDQMNALWSRYANGFDSAVPIAQNAFEVLLSPGVYDFVVVGQSGDDVRLFFFEQRVIENDVRFAIVASDAANDVALSAQFPIASTHDNAYVARVRLLLPDDGGSIVLPYLYSRILRTSSFSSRFGLLVSEALVRADGGEVAVAQHQPLRNVASDVNLFLASNDFRAQTIELRFPGGTPMRNVVIMPRDWARNPLEGAPVPPSLNVPAASDVWTTTLHMTPEVHHDYASGVQFSMITSQEDLGFRALNTPMVRRDANGFLSVRGFEKPASLPIYAKTGEVLRYGDSPIHPPAVVKAGGTSVLTESAFRGGWDEMRRAARLDGAYRVFDAAGVEISRGAVPDGSLVYLPLHGRGRRRVEVTTTRLENATWTMEFDTTHHDVIPPSITWLSIHDSAGLQSRRLPFEGSGSLVFAASNASASRTGVFFRRNGGATWVQLPVVESGSDAVAGTAFRVDLTDALRMQGSFDLRIELGNDEGHVTTWQHERAFESQPAPSGRKRRSVR